MQETQGSIRGKAMYLSFEFHDEEEEVMKCKMDSNSSNKVILRNKFRQEFYSERMEELYYPFDFDLTAIRTFVIKIHVKRSRRFNLLA